MAALHIALYCGDQELTASDYRRLAYTPNGPTPHWFRVEFPVSTTVWGIVNGAAICDADGKPIFKLTFNTVNLYEGDIMRVEFQIDPEGCRICDELIGHHSAVDLPPVAGQTIWERLEADAEW